MIGFYEEYEKLYQLYLRELSIHDIDKVLDVGCGNGNLLLHLQKKYDTCGIDISPKMVETAKSKGINVRCKSIKEVDEKFDAILAVADVLNYIHNNSLKDFFHDIERNLYKNALFICDINTLHGFENVTEGSLNIDGDDKFLSIDADFNDDVLLTEITLFQKADECYKKEQSTIFQYYHEIEYLQAVTNLELVKKQDIQLFSDESDKTLLVFKRT